MNSSRRINWFQANPRKARWLVFLLCFGFLEISIRLMVASGLLYHETYPTSDKPQFWAYIDPVVGMWRYPNKTLHHVTDCIDQVYETNSVGARDPERALKSAAPRRVVVLGDSMVEGHGVARGDRMTDILEAKTGVEHLNFGTSGRFGTIQQWLYYREYASQYDHSQVMLFILPANDFEDNDISEHSRSTYRPYLRKSGDTYEVYYPVEFADRDTAARPLSTIIKNTLDNNIYVLNALRYGMHVYKARRHAGSEATAKSYYDNYTDDDLAVMLHAINGIAELAAPRPLNIFTIPIEGDAVWAKENGYQFKLVDALTEFAEQRSNTSYYDLLPDYLEYAKQRSIPFRDFTLGCDGHWSRLGAEVAAQAVLNSVAN